MKINLKNDLVSRLAVCFSGLAILIASVYIGDVLSRFNPKISIIMPVYNTEKYLDECLNSIENQTLKRIEIICVNNGSKDGSLDILRKHAKKTEEFV